MDLPPLQGERCALVHMILRVLVFTWVRILVDSILCRSLQELESLTTFSFHLANSLKFITHII